MDQALNILSLLLTICFVGSFCSWTLNRRWKKKYLGIDDDKFKKQKTIRKWITLGLLIAGGALMIITIILFFVGN